MSQRRLAARVVPPPTGGAGGCGQVPPHRPIARAVLRVTLAVLGFLVLLPPGAAHADVDITPFIGYRSRGLGIFSTGIVCFTTPCPSFAQGTGSSIYGALVSVDAARNLRVDGLIDRQSTHLSLSTNREGPTESTEPFDLTQVQIGLSYPWRGWTVEPYVGSGIGLALLDSKGAGFAYLDETAWTVSVSGGLRVPITDLLGIRIHAQALRIDLPRELGGSMIPVSLLTGTSLHW